MKNVVLSIILLSSSSLFSETRKEVIDELVHQVVSENNELEEIEKYLKDSRDFLLESLKPDYENISDPEIIAQQEKLYFDAVSSSLYQGYLNGVKKSYAEDLDAEFTTQELVEIRELLNNPLFSRMENIISSNKSSAKRFFEEWKKNNEALVSEFIERKSEIDYQRKINLMLNPKGKEQQ